jgi:hypothetical protein
MQEFIVKGDKVILSYVKIGQTEAESRTGIAEAYKPNAEGVLVLTMKDEKSGQFRSFRRDRMTSLVNLSRV